MSVGAEGGEASRSIVLCHMGPFKSFDRSRPESVEFGYTLSSNDMFKTLTTVVSAGESPVSIQAHTSHLRADRLSYE